MDEKMKIELNKAVKVLKRGGVIAYPTDTAYGLGADPFNQKAVLKIFKIKKRDKKQSLPLIAANLKMVKEYGILRGKALSLAKKYWPNSLTLVIKVISKKEKIFSNYVIKNKKIAIRVPRNSIARKISALLGVPIISTSANLSGKPMCYSGKEIKEQFRGKKFKPDYILNAGFLKKSKPSTIVEVKNGKIKILRLGSIKPFE
ncbi:threonylcarbamoyl-AMP synthase [Candidatus Pacearchaeota archaeon]|nr:MAG: threonylcarbamoyl-AMP synthase [Candidatus Pacearchaeota archaeon]